MIGIGNQLFRYIPIQHNTALWSWFLGHGIFPATRPRITQYINVGLVARFLESVTESTLHKTFQDIDVACPSRNGQLFQLQRRSIVPSGDGLSTLAPQVQLTALEFKRHHRTGFGRTVVQLGWLAFRNTVPFSAPRLAIELFLFGFGQEQSIFFQRQFCNVIDDGFEIFIFGADGDGTVKPISQPGTEFIEDVRLKPVVDESQGTGNDHGLKELVAFNGVVDFGQRQLKSCIGSGGGDATSTEGEVDGCCESGEGERFDSVEWVGEHRVGVERKGSLFLLERFNVCWFDSDVGCRV